MTADTSFGKIDRPVELDIDGRRIRVTHSDRVIWPSTGTTKLHLIDYLRNVAPAMLPYLRGRPTMLWRFPEGIDGPGWFQAQCRSRPPWVPTFDIAGRKGDLLSYCLIEEPATLAWLANLGTIEFHPHGWTIDRPREPTAVVFDLDPGPPAGISDAARIALAVRDALHRLGFTAVAKTSGWSGLHVAAALSQGETYEEAKAFSRRLGDELAATMPDKVVRNNDRRARVGRVYLDWIQNDSARQLVAAYSPRATPVPTMSTPLTWDEVEAAADGRARPPRPSFDEMLRRLDRVGDLWLAGIPRAAGAVARLPGTTPSTPADGSQPSGRSR